MAEGLLELLFKINADPSEAQDALAKLKASTVAESTEISSVFSGAMEAITGPAGLALGAIVGLGGGMLELAHSSAEVGAQLYETAQKTGITVEALSGLRASATESGESFEGLSTSLGRATVLIDKAMISGKGLAADTLHALFKSTKEYNDFAALPMEQRLQALLHKIFELNSVEDQNTALSVFFGKAWQQNRETLEKVGTEGFDPLIEKAKEFNQFWTSEGAEQSKEFTKSWNDAKQAIAGVWDEIGRGLQPAIKSILDAMSGHVAGSAASVAEPWIKSQEEIKKYGFALKDATDEQLKQQVAALNTGNALDGLSIHVQGLHKSLAEMIGEGGEAGGGGGGGKAGGGGLKDLFKVLNDTHVILPKLETDFGALAKSLDEISKGQALEAIKFFVGMSEGGGGILSGGKAPQVDPFGQMTASMTRMIPVMGMTNNEAKQLLTTLLQIPPAAQQEIVAYQHSIQVKQQMIDISQTVIQTLFQELEAHKSLAAGMQAVYQQLLKDFFSWLTSYAEKKALADFALAADNWADPPAAAAYAAAGGLWLSLGAAGAIAGGLLTGKGGSASARGGSGVPGPGSGTVTPRGPGGASGYGGTQVNLYIDGVISPDTMEVIAPQIADALSTAVQNGGAQLYSTTTTQRPNTTQGG